MCRRNNFHNYSPNFAANVNKFFNSKIFGVIRIRTLSLEHWPKKSDSDALDPSTTTVGVFSCNIFADLNKYGIKPNHCNPKATCWS